MIKAMREKQDNGERTNVVVLLCVTESDKDYFEEVKELNL
jgi:hypothetical protein